MNLFGSVNFLWVNESISIYKISFSKLQNFFSLFLFDSFLTKNHPLFQDPKLYVQTILEVHNRYDALVAKSFGNDSGFVAALDKACGRFINKNAVTNAAKSSSKSPELLAK